MEVYAPSHRSGAVRFRKRLGDGRYAAFGPSGRPLAFVLLERSASLREASLRPALRADRFKFCYCRILSGTLGPFEASLRPPSAAGLPR